MNLFITLIYLDTCLNHSKIKKILNRYNFEDSDFRSMDEQLLETRNLAL